MEIKNGYFRMDIREMGVFLQIIPPENGGKRPEIKEILDYLEQKGYSGFNLKELNDAVTVASTEVKEVYVGEGSGFQEDEQMEITVSGDKMLVFCRFYPPSTKGKLMSEEDIVDLLKAKNITVGIKQEEIQKFLKDRRYCTDMILAKGIPPVNGKDAKIEYFFNTNHNLRPKKNEDGTVKPHLIKGMEVGKTYVLKETSSPYGFALTQNIEFTIQDTGKVQSVVMKDELVYGELEFNKRGEIFNQTISGQTEFGSTESPVWNESNLLGAEITIYANEDIKIGNTTYYKKDEKVQTLESDFENVTSKKHDLSKVVYWDIIPLFCFFFMNILFQSSMGLFHNTLSFRIIRNPSNMGNIKLLTKHLKCLTVIASSIICFNLIWNTKHRKIT